MKKAHRNLALSGLRESDVPVDLDLRSPFCFEKIQEVFKSQNFLNTSFYAFKKIQVDCPKLLLPRK